MSSPSIDYTQYKDTLIPLNLPAFAAPLRVIGADNRLQIRDPYRRKWVPCTPEEWVRQHLLHYLCAYKGYPPQAIGVELPVPGALRRDRADALVHGPASRPVLLLEFKAPDVPLGQAVLDQALRYNLYFQAPWIGLSNGREHVLLQTELPHKGLQPLDALPPYTRLAP